MNNAFPAISHNLKSLLRFNGRDDRATFWPYAGSVIGAAVMGMILALTSIFSVAADFAQRHPGRAKVESAPGQYSVKIEGNPSELAAAFGDLMIVVAVLFGVCIGLLAAAVARRLHDTGRTGVWGFMPVPFIIFSCTMMAALFKQADIDFGLFVAVFISNLLYLASLAVLVVLLTRPSDPISNSYGPSKSA